MPYNIRYNDGHVFDAPTWRCAWNLYILACTHYKHGKVTLCDAAGKILYLKRV